MPIYVYKCNKCKEFDERFVGTFTAPEEDANQDSGCSKCKDGTVKRFLTAPQMNMGTHPLSRRTDIELNVKTMDESIKQMQKSTGRYYG